MRLWIWKGSGWLIYLSHFSCPGIDWFVVLGVPMGPGLQFDPGLQLHLELEVGSLPKLVGYFVHCQPQFLTQKPEIKAGSFYKSSAWLSENLTFRGAESTVVSYQKDSFSIGLISWLMFWLVLANQWALMMIQQGLVWIFLVHLINKSCK